MHVCGLYTGCVLIKHRRLLQKEKEKPKQTDRGWREGSNETAERSGGKEV